VAAMSRRRWLASDYDTIEALAPFGLAARWIGEYLDPPATGRQVIDACRKAGIRLGRGRGRPSIEQQAAWNRLHRAHRAALADDAERREQIIAYAASLGYAVIEVRRMAPGQTS
jgi:hypothetical protein